MYKSLYNILVVIALIASLSEKDYADENAVIAKRVKFFEKQATNTRENRLHEFCNVQRVSIWSRASTEHSIQDTVVLRNLSAVRSVWEKSCLVRHYVKLYCLFGPLNSRQKK